MPLGDVVVVAAPPIVAAVVVVGGVTPAADERVAPEVAAVHGAAASLVEVC